MNTDLLALVVSAVASILAAVLSWRTRKLARDTELVLQTKQKVLSVRSSRSLDPIGVEQRLRALAEVSPDAAVVDAWRTLEALVNRVSGDAETGPVHGRQVHEYLLREGYVEQEDAALLDTLLSARNKALHMVESAPTLPVSAYLPMVLRVAAKARTRAV